MLKKIVTKDEFLSFDSEKFSINGNQKYSLNTTVIAQKGVPYSAYFGAILFDEKDREIDRKIRWITNFKDEPTSYKLVFTTPHQSKFLILCYRINIETPVKSDVEISFQDPSSINLHEDTTSENTFDDISKYSIPKFPSLSEEEEVKLERKLVWICASPRSGTTWLGTRLLKHGDNIIWNEPWIGLHLGVLRGGLAPVRDFHRFSPEDSEKIRNTQSQNHKPIIDFKFDRIIDMQARNGEYFFSPHHKNNWLPLLRKLILNRTYSHAQTCKKNIIVKDPVGSNGIDIISECLPNSKIIFLIRDGRDEVDSRIDMHRKNSWAELMPLEDEQERNHAINYYSKLWVVNNLNIKKCFEHHSNELKLLIKYEDLVRDTFAEIKKVYDFIGIQTTDDEIKQTVKFNDFKNIPDSEKGPGKFNRSASPGGWQNNFTKEEQDLMNSIMGKTLKEMGYQL